METIEVVIKIPKKCKEFLDNGGKVDWLDAIPIIDAIANGIPLPKGHGRIGDLDRLYSVFERNVVSAKAFKELFDNAPVIIECDREAENADSD